MIRVIAAGALDRVAIDVPVIARTLRALDDPILHSRELDVLHSYDALFDGSLDDADLAIARDLERRASESDIMYLVPELPGDLTVERLAPGSVASSMAAAPDRGSFGQGKCQIVDALEIALAELQSPFDRGYLAIEPTIPTVVTNWYGDTVRDLAGKRLRRHFGVDELPGDVCGLELLIPAVERLRPAASIAGLEHIVARLRRPDGCPWDRDQTKESLLPQFVDELGEFGDAITSGDVANQLEELGDVLFHVVAQCQLAAEAGEFSLDDVLREVTAKLLRRHPHVFGDVTVDSYEDVLATWNRVKAEEKSAAGRERD